MTASSLLANIKSDQMKAAWKGRQLRAKGIGLPAVLTTCALCFLAGFYGSALLSYKHLSGPGAHGQAKLGIVGAGLDLQRMPHGENGEPGPLPAYFQVLSWRPRTLYFPNFASTEQCEVIIKMANLRLKPSDLALREGETAENTKGIRTSSGTFISASEDPTGTLDFVERKIARVTMIPRENGEAFNVLRYQIGQRYASHYDAFNPAEYGKVKNQRVASFLLYLSDVEEGGETMFPYENGMNMDGKYDYEKCIGLKIRPRQGDGLLFHSLFLNGTIDPTSLHGSCPVVKGEKWVATKWLTNQIEDDV